MKRLIQLTCILTLWCSLSHAGVTLSSPTPDATVGSPVHFVASASSDFGRTTASMIIYVDNVNKYHVYSNHLDTYLSITSGTHNIIIKSWDSAGAIVQKSLSISVGPGTPTPTPAPPAGALVFSNIDQMSDWGSCDACAGAGGTGPTAPHSLTHGINSPSMDGNSTKFWLGGSTPYSNALWWRHLMTDATKIKPLHHFIYDLYFYIDNASAAQSLEWDVNQYVSGKSYVMGTQCSYRSKGTWDIWDNINKHWISTGIACPALQAYTWNHVVVEFERTTDSRLRYVSVSMNGVKHYLNRYYSPRSTSWSGVTVNYQMDGNSRQDDYTTWADKMTLTAW